MKAVVDRLSDELSRKYLAYLETFLVDLWSEAGFIEFRCGFTLRRDHALRQFTLKVPAVIGETDAERELLIIVVFEQIEQLIDEAVAENKAEVN
jgi:hypothetical protein